MVTRSILGAVNDARALSEHDAKQLLAGLGVPISREKVVATVDDAVAAAAEIGHPTVLKLSGAEIMHMAENGFCKDGEQEEWLAEGWSEIGGKLPINTDGGCIACGEPIGASGLRQIYENAQQLRGRAGERQVPGSPQIGYSHVYGAPGLSAVAILQA